MRWTGVLLTLLGLFSPSSSHAATLDEHLAFLQPLIGTQWVGGFVGEAAPDLEITLRFEEILDGRAVRYTRDVPAASFSAETLFYWSSEGRTVRFLNLNNNGITGEGVVEFVDGQIVITGTSYRPEGNVEFTTLLEMDADGTLRDIFTGTQDGESVPGHAQEFGAR
ncbi:MAG TPA: hypothetical protein DCP38_14935 [Acidobacteria bacterium]|nr:hypothetical protein [Vicinamibacterales bacterium]HAK56760.1 hypothetical protein [Acidobacteriota bacterium]